MPLTIVVAFAMDSALWAGTTGLKRAAFPSGKVEIRPKVLTNEGVDFEPMEREKGDALMVFASSCKWRPARFNGERDGRCLGGVCRFK